MKILEKNKKTSLALLAIMASVSLLGCEQKYAITQGSGGNNGGGGGNPTPAPTCTQTITTTTAQLGIMFMLDNSGSTVGANGTDPNYTYRVGAIQTFLNQYGTKTNLKYSFGYFSGSTAKLYDMASNTFRAPGSTGMQYFGDASAVTAALAAFQSIGSSGSTPYAAAFNALGVAALADIGINGGLRDYVVVFESDGAPTDMGSPVSSSQISGLVTGFQGNVGSNNSSIVSAVYFGPTTQTGAISNMQLIATTGGGQFVNTNVSSTLTISDVITIPGCH